MSKGLRKTAGAVLFTGALLAAGAVVAQEKAVYLFHMRKDLQHLITKEPAKVVGKKVAVVDEMLVVWPEVQQRKNRLGGKSYVLFDTTYFHCAVPTENMGAHLKSIWDDAQKGYREVTKRIEDVNEQERTGKIAPAQANDMRRELYWELNRVWSNKPVVKLYGTVERADFWGDVQGKSAGVATEMVSLVVDRVEKPRRRWYKSLDEY